MELILASGSPRRQQMLRDLGLAFRVQAPEINESRLRGEPAQVYVQRLARQKAESVPEQDIKDIASWVILAADTIVVYGSLVLGKPRDADEAVKMLTKLSGRTHEVLTGYCWRGMHKDKPRMAVTHVRTKVTFAEMPKSFWQWYVSTGEPMDKAGSYAAQGIGMSFISKVSGSYSNVVGLPLSHALKTFEKLFGGDLRDYCGTSR